MKAFDIFDVAEKIKSLYTSILRIHPSRRYVNYSPPVRWAGVWPAAASQCLEYDLDPEALVRALVDARADARVNPSQLLGERAVQRTRAYMRTNDIERSAIRSQLAKLSALVDTGANVVEALMSMEEDFSVALRYAFAIKAGLPAVAASFREAARRELRFNKKKLEVMKGMLPEAFVNEVLCDEYPADSGTD